MLHSISEGGFSTTVRGWLIVDGIQLPLAQVGPDFCILRTATEVPHNTAAELVIQVDQRTRCQNIRILDGCPATTRLNYVLVD